MADEKKKISSLDPIALAKPDDSYVVSQGIKTFRESREQLRTDLKNYVLQGAGQPGGVVQLDENGQLPGFSVPSKVLDTVAELSTVDGSFAGSIVVKDPARGGTFVHVVDYAVAVNDGTVFAASDAGKWVRLYNGPIDFKWFGAPVNGVDDDTPFCQAAIDSIGMGVYEFTPGNWRIDGLTVPSGVVLFSNQNARDYQISQVLAKISKHANTATKMIEIESGAQNVSLISLYVEGDYSNNPDTVCGAHLRGKNITVFNCNFNAFAGAAVISECTNSNIDYNSIFGWYGAAPSFTSVTDFRGALQIESMYDSYVTRNKIGAGLPCFDTYTNPLNMLRDQTARRIAAVACRGFVGSCVFSGNTFDTGDRAFILGEAQCNVFTNNRYELSGAGGLYVYGPAFYQSFTGERFSNNSLSRNGGGVGPVGGGYYDIEISAGAGDKMTFTGCVFQRITNGLIPTSTYKVRSHIAPGGATDIELIGCKFDVNYSTHGVGGGRIGVSVLDVKNPEFESVKAKAVGFGSAELSRGFITQNMGYVVLRDNSGNPLCVIGNSPQEYVSFYNQTAGSIFAFGGANMALQKSGDSEFSLWSLDGTGDSQVIFKGYSDSRNSAAITLDNGTGDFNITSNGDIVLGAGNLRIKSDGSTILPELPAGLVLDVGLLGRNVATGQLVDVDPLTVGHAPVVGNPGLDTALTDEELNTMYPYSVYQIGTRIICRNITTGGITYERDGGTSWIRYAHL